MAEQTNQDVVKEAQSMGSSPIDANATTTISTSAGDGEAVSSSQNSTRTSQNMPESPTKDSHNKTPEAPATTADKPADKPADTSVDTPAHPDRSPVEPAEPQVNGDGEDHPALEDSAHQHFSVDMSGGSDTDTSRGDMDPSKDSSGRHPRSSSGKKPPAFKSVSVTKNFLAKTAVSSTSSRVDKPSALGQTSAVLQPTAKPRLVAKSGSGLGSLPRSGLSKMNGAGGPDPNQVWNKNRPTPPPPPKQFTDEELKQQYGIHMATRLQADETGKESKWADIEDDEEDWAPDTVEWMDGTKSTLKSTENLRPPEDPKIDNNPTSDEKKPEATDGTHTTNSTAQRPTSKTILKPGAHVQSNQPKSGSLVLKGVSEKPTLVVKPSTTAPAKSPWAPLPPVDKVPPVQINPPTAQPPQSRFARHDPHGFDALPPAPSPAKEIAADDFSRSWKDDRANKELYNSHSGRYEPVNETGRSSFRDGSLRQPSVLQRPAQNDAQGPAEPSAAFQTSRSALDGVSWGRRRTSSNVSGGSGRRPSFGRHSEASHHDSHDRSTRLAEVESGALPLSHGRPLNKDRGYSPVGPRQQASAQHESPAPGHAQPLSPYESVASSGVGEPQGPPVSNSPVQDPVAVQQQLMREKIEKARVEKQRRLEEEAKEEAARKERLRLKLEALGPPPEVKESKDDKPKEATGSAPEGTSQLKDKAATSSSPPKPPVPTSDGEIAQYGMIKVHQPHPVKKPVVQHDAPVLETKHTQPKPAEATSENVVSVRPEPLSTSPSTVHPAKYPPKQPDAIDLPANVPQHDGERVPHAWKPTQPKYGGWTGLASQRSVWGPPSQHDNRALGNGTFDGGYRGQSAGPGLRGTSSVPSPGPIAPPTIHAPHQAQPFEQPRNFLQPTDGRTQPPLAPPGLAQVAETNMALAHPNRPGPIAPPHRAPSAPQERSNRKFSVADWQTLPERLHQQEAEALARRKEELRMQPTQPRVHDNIKETFSQTVPNGLGGKRRVIKTETTLNSSDGSRVAELPTQSSPMAEPHLAGAVELQARPASSELYRPGASSEELAAQRYASQPSGQVGNLVAPYTSQGPRGSRFFPRPAETPGHAQDLSINLDSPPPPETMSHPVFEGDIAHPKVNLPQPKARVRLPPSPSKPSGRTVRPEQPRLGSQPIVAQSAWQKRFNGLFNKEGTSQHRASAVDPHTGTAVAAVLSASKDPFDVQEHAATVSLPSSITCLSGLQLGVEQTSKPMSDYLFEDRQHGDTPVVKFPKGVQASRNAGIVMPGPRAKPRQPHVLSIEPWFPCVEHNDVDFQLRIKLPGSDALKTLSAPISFLRLSAENAISGQHKPRRNFTPRNRDNNVNASHPRSRKPSNYNSQNAVQPTTSRASSNPWNNQRNNSSGNPWSKHAASSTVH